MNSIDPIFTDAFAVDTDPAAAEIVKTAFPDFPDEKPSKKDIIKYLDSWEEDLNTAGYGAFLRGETPHQLAKLAPRPLLDVPARKLIRQES